MTCFYSTFEYVAHYEIPILFTQVYSSSLPDTFLLTLNGLQLLSHPFIKKYEDTDVDLGAYARSVFDPKQRLKEMADVSAY